MAPRASLPLLLALFVVLCLAVPALSATKSSGRSASLTRTVTHTKASSRTASPSRTASRTHTKPRVHPGVGGSGVPAPSTASASSVATGTPSPTPAASVSLSVAVTPTAAAFPSLSASNTPPASSSSSTVPTLSLTPTFSPTFFLSRCSKVTLSTYFAADCAGVAATLDVDAGCNALTAGATTVNLLYAINNGLPTVAIFDSTDNACGNVPTASYVGALDTCVNQGTTSFVLTCAVVASQTPSPSAQAIPLSAGNDNTAAMSTTPTAFPSPSASAATNAALCTAAVLNIFSASDCTGFPNVLGGSVGINQLALDPVKADGTLINALGTCGPTTRFLGRDYFAVYTNVRGTPWVTLYADDTKCKNAVNAVNWHAPNAAPVVGLVAGTNYGGKAQYTGVFNTCVRSATGSGSYTIGCISAAAGASVSATPAAVVLSPTCSPSPKTNQCSSITVSLYSYVSGAPVSCTDASKLFLSYSIPLYTCTPASVAGYTALAIANIASTSPVVYSSTDLVVYYYTDASSCVSDLTLLETKGSAPANSVSVTVTSALDKADADTLATNTAAEEVCAYVAALDYTVLVVPFGIPGVVDGVYYYIDPALCASDLAKVTGTALTGFSNANQKISLTASQFSDTAKTLVTGSTCSNQVSTLGYNVLVTSGVVAYYASSDTNCAGGNVNPKSPLGRSLSAALVTALGAVSGVCKNLIAPLGSWVLNVPFNVPLVSPGAYTFATEDACITAQSALPTTPTQGTSGLTSFPAYTSFGHASATVGTCTDLSPLTTAPVGVAAVYGCNGYAPSATPAPSATAVPHPALCASLAVLTFPASDATCAMAPVDANTGIESPINPFSSSPQTTKCLSTTLLGTNTYYTITIPAISAWTAASVTYSTYAPVVTLYGADSKCGVAGLTYDLALIDNGLGGSLAVPNGKAWGALGPDGKTNLCYGHTNTGSAGGTFTDHYQITCAIVISPSATPSPSPSACAGDVIVSVYYAGNTITLNGVGTEGGVDTCRPQPYIKGSVTYASNYIGNFTVPATCGPVTYSSAFPSVIRLDDLSLATGTYLAPNLYGSVDYSSTNGPAVSLFGGTTPTNWGYQPDNYCVTGLTSKGAVAVITQTLGAAAADGAACTTYTTGAAVQWANAQAAVPTYYYTYTCANRASATPTPSITTTPTISTTPVKRLLRA